MELLNTMDYTLNSTSTAQMAILNSTQSVELEENGVMDLLHVYLTPVVALLGIVGNVLSILIFMLTYLNRQTSSVYLAFLAFVDSIFLFCQFIGWFGYLGVHLFHRPVWCQVVVYFTYVSAFLSVWTVASFTVERYIVVFHPLQRHVYCTRRRSFLVISSITASALLYYSFSLVTSKVTLNEKYGMSFCGVLPKYYQVVRILSSVDTVVTLIIPSVIIILFNTAIACKVRMFAKRYSMDSEASSSDIESDPDNTGHKESTRRRTVESHQLHMIPRSHRSSLRMRAQMRTTKALLAISSIFILLNLPSHAFRVYVFIRSHISSEPIRMSDNALQIQAFAQFLYHMNFAANFLLYSAWSANFRRALSQTVRKMRSCTSAAARSSDCTCRIWGRTNSNNKPNKTIALYTDSRTARVTSRRVTTQRNTTARNSSKIQFKVIVPHKRQ